MMGEFNLRYIKDLEIVSLLKTNIHNSSIRRIIFELNQNMQSFIESIVCAFGKYQPRPKATTLCKRVLPLSSALFDEKMQQMLLNGKLGSCLYATLRII